MITFESASELFSYDDEGGVLYWKKPVARRVKIGDRVGCINHYGYVTFEYLGKSYLAHRVIWLIKTGKWPEKWIDHIDGDRSNNVISNLRDVSVQGNCQNVKGARKNNKLGFLGVTLEARTNKFAAYIRINKKHVRLGSFKTPEEAHHAYLEAKRNNHECNTL